VHGQAANRGEVDGNRASAPRAPGNGNNSAHAPRQSHAAPGKRPAAPARGFAHGGHAVAGNGAARNATSRSHAAPALLSRAPAKSR
jgi:hypothetical protein